MWGGILGIGFVVLVPWVFVQWRLRVRFMRLVGEHACALCHNRFDDAIADYLGRVGIAERRRLDRFQRRFAAYRIRCGDCHAVNVCTRDGQPFKAYIADP
ncbi:MAG TPA: hypothetical protein VEL07_01380 [Planctomycetota bacterium]|nr:hypothetical protein [Planctomycetota bacterium]